MADYPADPAATSAHAFSDDLSKLDAVGTAEAIRAGDYSITEVIDAAIDRAESLSDRLGAIVTPDFDRARAAARRLSVDPGGLDLPFVGVPTFIKDNMDQQGLPTRQGSGALKNASPAKHNGKVVGQLFEMGMISLGKSALPEFGFSPSAELLDGTAVHNPWNLNHTPGGSSAGSAALVAAGVVPVAHGADGGGSIRIPAACCGLVGLKVTRGRLYPDLGSRLMPVDILTEGLLTRSVRDLALHIARAEMLYKSKKLPAVGHVDRPMKRRLRVGVLHEVPMGSTLDPATQRCFDDTVALLEDLGHRVAPVSLPSVEDFAEDFLQYWGSLVFIVRKFGNLLYDKSFDRTKLVSFTNLMGDRFKASKAPGNILRLHRSTAKFSNAVSGFDVVLSPTLAQLPPKLGHLASDQDGQQLFDKLMQWMPYTPLANGTGLPAISLPLGRDADTNLPIGMMFHADMGAEALLIQLAYELEQARPWPSLADLAS